MPAATNRMQGASHQRKRSPIPSDRDQSFLRARGRGPTKGRRPYVLIGTQCTAAQASLGRGGLPLLPLIPDGGRRIVPTGIGSTQKSPIQTRNGSFGSAARIAQPTDESRLLNYDAAIEQSLKLSGPEFQSCLPGRRRAADLAQPSWRRVSKSAICLPPVAAWSNEACG